MSSYNRYPENLKDVKPLKFNSIQFFINLEQYNSSDQSTFTYKSNIEIYNSGWTWVVIIVKLIIWWPSNVDN